MQRTKIWEKDSDRFSHKSLDKVIEDLIRTENIINCIVPLKYDAMSNSIKEALIIYTILINDRHIK